MAKSHPSFCFLAVLLSQNLMGSINYIKFPLHCPCCQLTRHHQELFFKEKNGAVIRSQAGRACGTNATYLPT